MSKLVESLGDLFDLKRRKSSPVHGETWRVGALSTDLGLLTLYLHPRLKTEEDANSLRDALSRETGSAFRLIFTADGALPIRNAEDVALQDLVELNAEDGKLVALADIRTLARMPLCKPGGAPNRFGEPLLTLIRSRAEKGESLEGLNEEAKAVRAVFSARYPKNSAPSLSTIKRYLSGYRAGP